jgi:hypothetical protein
MWRFQSAPRGDVQLPTRPFSSPRPVFPLRRRSGFFGPGSSHATSGAGIAPQGGPSESRRRRVLPENPMAAPPAFPRQFRCAAGPLIEKWYVHYGAGLKGGDKFFVFSLQVKGLARKLSPPALLRQVLERCGKSPSSDAGYTRGHLLPPGGEGASSSDAWRQRPRPPR